MVHIIKEYLNKNLHNIKNYLYTRACTRILIYIIYNNNNNNNILY